MVAVLVALLIVTEAVHSVWLVRLPVLGQVADPAIPLIVTIAFRRPAWGPWIGLSVGLLQDLLFGGSLGLFALTKFLVGQGAGILGRTVLVDRPGLPWLITAAVTAAHQVVLALVLAVTGLLPVSIAALGTPLLAQVGLNLIVAWPAFALVGVLLPVRVSPRPREGLHGI